MMELLTVIAIIALLVGLLVPGLGKVKQTAQSLKMKAVLHSMEVGMNFFAEDNGGLPDSSAVNKGDGVVCGAQVLAEALLGRDGLGFDPESKWYAPDQPDDVYRSDEDTPEGKRSMNRRKKTYVELKDTGLVLLQGATPEEGLYDAYTGDLYADNTLNPQGAPVITDIFRHRKVRQTLASGEIEDKWQGNPIVYFKADDSSRYFREDTAQHPENEWIYNYRDNVDIFLANSVNDPVNDVHEFNPTFTKDIDSQTVDGKDLFYRYITNPQATPPTMPDVRKPFNPKTFILMSAGYDGIFGTKDDITNFNY